MDLNNLYENSKQNIIEDFVTGMSEEIPAALFVCNFEKLTQADFKYFLVLMSHKFNVNYCDKNCFEFARAKRCFEIAIEQGFTKLEFKKAVQDFELNFSYPNWNYSDILKPKERHKLLSQAEFMKLCDNKNFSIHSFRCYNINGTPAYQFITSPLLKFPLWNEKKDSKKKDEPPATKEDFEKLKEVINHAAYIKISRDKIQEKKEQKQHEKEERAISRSIYNDYDKGKVGVYKTDEELKAEAEALQAILNKKEEVIDEN